MDVPETERELYTYLRGVTGSFAATNCAGLTTADIASALSISRNLASQYLNDLVRVGLVVKAGTRPIYYFERRELERRLQASVDESVYASLDDLLSLGGVDGERDFARLVGHDLSLSACIERLKSAIAYPPDGLPVLMTGEPGSGKTLLANAVFEYGRGRGILSPSSNCIVIDCGQYRDALDRFLMDLKGSMDEGGWYSRAEGGVLVFRDVDLLPTYAQELLLTEASCGQAHAGFLASRPRFVLTSAKPSDSLELSILSRGIASVVEVPSLRERSDEEREELMLRFLKDEGVRAGTDVLMSKAAYRALIHADFVDNVRGLRECVTTCCAAAYSRGGGAKVEIRAFMLPFEVLGSMEPGGADDSAMLDVTRTNCISESGKERFAAGGVAKSLASLLISDSATNDVERNALDLLGAYASTLAFWPAGRGGRPEAFSRLLETAIAETNETFGLGISKKTARVLAVDLHALSLRGMRSAEDRTKLEAPLAELFSTMAAGHPVALAATRRLSEFVSNTLGLVSDALWNLLALSLILEQTHNRGRTSVGIILCHGYATATSIADSANHMLGAHVFEGVDMRYEQSVSDIAEAFLKLLDRYSFCREVAVLVDMGSLEGVLELVDGRSQATFGVINNASTGIALEIGAGLIAGESLEGVLASAASTAEYRYRVVEAMERDRAIVFCSDLGVEAAEKIRALVSGVLGDRLPLVLLACDAGQLRRNGRGDALFSAHEVMTIVGTDDPGVEGVPFVALEDLISNEASASFDRILSEFMDSEELTSFHERLVERLTLRNVIESITILNPEKLLDEVTGAVRALEHLCGISLTGRTMAGLCVHLCCLVERLVTRSAFEPYACDEGFDESHADFIELFNEGFRGVAAHYRVAVPVSEIAYVFDYVRHGSSLKGGDD